jgi:hypothetical protein
MHGQPFELHVDDQPERQSGQRDDQAQAEEGMSVEIAEAGEPHLRQVGQHQVRLAAGGMRRGAGVGRGGCAGQGVGGRLGGHRHRDQEYEGRGNRGPCIPE